MRLTIVPLQQGEAVRMRASIPVRWARGSCAKAWPILAGFGTSEGTKTPFDRLLVGAPHPLAASGALRRETVGTCVQCVNSESFPITE